MTIRNRQTFTDPKLIDAALDPLLVELSSGLDWLRTAYGRCEAIAVDDSYRNYVPAVFVGKGGNTGADNEYLGLLPDDRLGSFSFFDVVGRQEYLSPQGSAPRIRFEAGLVVWFDFRDVFDDGSDGMSVENVKASVLAILNTSVVGMSIAGTFDRVPEVYRGYDYTNLQSMFAQRPYGCFRINTVITYQADRCL